jgi:hypothetical protein
MPQWSADEPSDPAYPAVVGACHCRDRADSHTVADRIEATKPAMADRARPTAVTCTNR